MQQIKWIDRKFSFDLPGESLPAILERLKGAMARITERVLEVTDIEAELKHNDKWSIKEHIGHLADLEELHDKRITEFIEKKEMLSAADISNTATENANHNKVLIEHLISDFTTKRVQFIDHIEELDIETQQFKSIHPRLKIEMRPVDFCFFVAEHDDHHILSMRRIVDELRKM